MSKFDAMCAPIYPVEPVRRMATVIVFQDAVAGPEFAEPELAEPVAPAALVAFASLRAASGTERRGRDSGWRPSMRG